MDKKEELPLVLITHALPGEWLSSLEGKCRTLIGPAEGNRFPEELLDALQDTEGILALLVDKIDEPILKAAPKLRVVSNFAVGVDNVDIAACTRRGIPVGNTPGILTNATADLTLALMLAAARKLPQATRDARDGKWKSWAPAGWLGLELSGAVLGIVGMGKIGSAVARRAAGFGMSIVYTNLIPYPEIEVSLGARRVSLDELLAISDIVSLHVPLTDETRRMMDADAFLKMRPGAILVNVARGPVVDMDALYSALSHGTIAAAALDVTDPEPLPPDHPLYALPNCLIVPHIGSATDKTRSKMAEIACDNLLAGLRGAKLPFCVNPEVIA
ncbi:MAG TPA: D-glycerate dehydrogenase [Anaerolineaceae bacterium]|nr:D-glycerate dehydrogenase [Anaerolineaceae bacterium]